MRLGIIITGHNVKWVRNLNLTDLNHEELGTAVFKTATAINCINPPAICAGIQQSVVGGFPKLFEVQDKYYPSSDTKGVSYTRNVRSWQVFNRSSINARIPEFVQTNSSLQQFFLVSDKRRILSERQSEKVIESFF